MPRFSLQNGRLGETTREVSEGHNKIERIRQSVVDKPISFNPIELECRLDILKSYIEQVIKLQSDVDNLDSDNDDRAELVNLCDHEKFV